MIKFEEHDGKLFKMLDKPVPLEEKDTNVLVQFITHGVIGEYVMEHWLDCGQENAPIFVDSVDSDGDVTVFIENGNEHYGCPFPMFEIIGIFVAEGSRWWALYQMMQGKKVSYKSAIGNVYWALNQDGNAQQYTMDNFAYIGAIRSKLEFGKNHAVNTGWQLYEPEQPKYKVGDWVEYRGSFGIHIGRIDAVSPGGSKVHIYVSDAHGLGVDISCLRKLSPSEVILDFGSGIKGTVRSCEHDGGCVRVISGDRVIAHIMTDALEQLIRNIVKQLLKAQEES